MSSTAALSRKAGPPGALEARSSWSTSKEPHPGLIAAHFHISGDGTQILNYAEWVHDQAHRDALENGPTQGIGQTDSPHWGVHNMPGVTSAGLQRYCLKSVMAAPAIRPREPRGRARRNAAVSGSRPQ
jgi:hypothetical protein